ncbi:MAG: hypothetical protein GXP42_16795 [Chloroflexi bacterium]|nr:hypothetical protein [Chloroflexota bacterium]
MTTVREQALTCAVCGHTEKHTVLVSSSAFGASDLDTRPPPLMRFTLPFQIQCCPACGYCAPNISHAPDRDIAASIVLSKDYQAQLRDAELPYLASMFLCASDIQKALGNDADAGWFALRAAWVCDDEERDQGARQCRLRAVERFTQARERGQPFADQPGAEEAILTDLLRRSGRFDEATAMIRRGLARTPEDVIREALLFQRALCEQRDVARHTLDEVLKGDA